MSAEVGYVSSYDFIQLNEIEIKVKFLIRNSSKSILDRQPLQRTDGSLEWYPWIRILRVPLDSY